MERKSRSNTEALDATYVGNDGTGLVEVQNQACIRTRNQPPTVFPAQYMSVAHSNKVRGYHVVPENSEKLDLINILNCFARADASDAVTAVAHTSTAPADAAHALSFDCSERTLHSVLLDRFGEKRKVAHHSTSSDAWPSIHKAAKVKAKQDIHTEELDTNDLDAQLSQWSSPSGHNEYHCLTDEQSAHLLCNEVKHSVLSVVGDALQWQDGQHMVPALTVAEPFRCPSMVLRELVRDRLFLLDDHSIAVNVKRKAAAAGSSADAALSGGGTTAPGKFVNSKEHLLGTAVGTVDVADVVQQVPAEHATSVLVDSVKYQVVECALARHVEALADAALELVFQRLAPPQPVEDTSNAASNSASSNIAQRKHPVTSDIESEGSPVKKRKKSDTRLAKTECVPADTELLTWEDVLSCLQHPLPSPTTTEPPTHSAHAGQPTPTPADEDAPPHRRPANVMVHPSLPPLHLSTTVLQRTTRRLRAIYKGETALGTVGTVSSVFNYTPTHQHTSRTRSHKTSAVHATSTQPSNSQLAAGGAAVQGNNKTRDSKKDKKGKKRKSKKNQNEKVGGQPDLAAPHLLRAVWETHK